MGRKSNAQKEAEAASAQQIDDEFGFDDAVGGAQLGLDDDLPPPAEQAFDPFAPSAGIIAKLPTPPPGMNLHTPPAVAPQQPAPPVTRNPIQPAVARNADSVGVPPANVKPVPPAERAIERATKPKATNGAAGPVTDWRKVLPGILNQLENISRVLEGRGTPKSARAIGKLGEVLVWVNDDLRDLK